MKGECELITTSKRVIILHGLEIYEAKGEIVKFIKIALESDIKATFKSWHNGKIILIIRGY